MDRFHFHRQSPNEPYGITEVDPPYYPKESDVSQAAMFHTDKHRLDELISEAARTQVEHEQDVGDPTKRQTASDADVAYYTYWMQFDKSMVPPNYAKDQYFREKHRWRREIGRQRYESEFPRG